MSFDFEDTFKSEGVQHKLRRALIFELASLSFFNTFMPTLSGKRRYRLLDKMINKIKDKKHRFHCRNHIAKQGGCRKQCFDCVADVGEMNLLVKQELVKK